MVIFLDVDGTLINYETVLPESARYAINKARANGHKVYICTGCSKFEIEVKNWNLELDGMIGGNGCYVESNNKVVMHETLSLSQCKQFVDWCNQRDLAFRLECNEGIYISEGYEEKSKEARLKYIEGIDAVLTKDKIVPMNPSMIIGGNLLRSDVNKTGFVLKSYQDYLDAVTAFNDLKVGTWGGKGEHALYGDTSRKNINKAYAIEVLLGYLKIDKSKTIAFGDAKVDIPMFNCCGYSVAMGNAGEETKQAADYITDDVDNDGLMKAFEYLGLI